MELLRVPWDPLPLPAKLVLLSCTYIFPSPFFPYKMSTCRLPVPALEVAAEDGARYCGDGVLDDEVMVAASAIDLGGCCCFSFFSVTAMLMFMSMDCGPAASLL